jgi:hypothetical protein
MCSVVGEETHMSTNKKATVTHALEKHTARRVRARIVELFGTLEWDDSVDHKRTVARDRKLALNG